VYKGAETGPANTVEKRSRGGGNLLYWYHCGGSMESEKTKGKRVPVGGTWGELSRYTPLVSVKVGLYLVRII